MARVIFVTGTGTGVGKTVATGILLHGLRRQGIHALALKPFCTGSRADVRHLARLQDAELSLDEINPFHYAMPLAPLVAAGSRSPAIEELLERVKIIARRCDLLLVEGAGGLLVPFGNLPRCRASASSPTPGVYSAAEVIHRLDSGVIVVAPNTLGTLSHTLLTINALARIRRRELSVLLVEQRRPDLSARTNRVVLQRLLTPIKIVSMPHFGRDPLRAAALESNKCKIDRLLLQFTRIVMID